MSNVEYRNEFLMKVRVRDICRAEMISGPYNTRQHTESPPFQVPEAQSQKPAGPLALFFFLP